MCGQRLKLSACLGATPSGLLGGGPNQPCRIHCLLLTLADEQGDSAAMVRSRRFGATGLAQTVPFHWPSLATAEEAFLVLLLAGWQAGRGSSSGSSSGSRKWPRALLCLRVARGTVRYHKTRVCNLLSQCSQWKISGSGSAASINCRRTQCQIALVSSRAGQEHVQRWGVPGT
jgi:hypothetical protein